MCGRRIVSASLDGTIKTWTESDPVIPNLTPWAPAVSDGVCTSTLHGPVPNNPIFCAQWLKHSHGMLTGSSNASTYIWDLHKQAVTGELKGHSGSVYSLYKAEEGTINSTILTGASDHTIKIWDEKTNHCETTLTGHSGSVMTVKSDGAYQVSSSQALI